MGAFNPIWVVKSHGYRPVYEEKEYFTSPKMCLERIYTSKKKPEQVGIEYSEGLDQ